MPAAPITGLYASLCAIIMVALASRVARIRWQTGAGVGETGDKRLARAIRSHSDAVEYIPIAVILLLMAELNGSNHALLHACGIILVAARIAHAIGLLGSAGVSAGRVIGVGCTVAVIGVLAVVDLSTIVL